MLIANTGGDRMFDWGGEFNSYLVPFSPFGNPTVVRSPTPHVQQFLLDLGRESGADQTLTEPNGELGLFTHSDPRVGRRTTAGRATRSRATSAAPSATPRAGRRTTAAPPCRSPSTPADRGPRRPCGSTVSTSPSTTSSSLPTRPTPRRLALFVGGTNGDDIIEVRRRQPPR